MLISSGSPWWEVELEGQGPFSNQVPALELMNLPDYILFRGGTILAQGRFDREWRLSDADASALAATDVVDVRQGTSGSR